MFRVPMAQVYKVSLLIRISENKVMPRHMLQMILSWSDFHNVVICTQLHLEW